jgi:hypothetical protein
MFAVLGSIWLAYSGVHPVDRPNLLPFLAILAALAPFFLRTFELATPGSGGRYAAFFGLAWLGLNPINAGMLNDPVRRPLLLCILGMVLGLVVYQWFPSFRKYGLFLAPVLGAAFCDRATLVFAPLLFLYIFLLEEKGEPWAIPSSVLRCLPALAVSLVTFVTPTAAPALPHDAGPLSGLLPICAFGVALIAATSRATRLVSFGLFWYVCGIYAAPSEPLLAFAGLAFAGAWLVARAVALLPKMDLRMVAAACVCLLAIDAASLMQHGVLAYDRTVVFVQQQPAPAPRPEVPADNQLPNEAKIPPNSSPNTLPNSANSPASNPANNSANPATNPAANAAAATLAAARLLDLSLNYYQAGKFPEAIGAAQAAIRIKPDFPEAYNNMAASYSNLKQWDAAIAAAQKALILKPDFTLARNNLNWALEQKRLAGQ